MMFLKATIIIFPAGRNGPLLMGSLAGALLIITFFARVFPIIPIQETIMENHEKEA